MSRKFEPREAPERESRPIPRRRIPDTCEGGSRSHEWLVGEREIRAGLPTFFERHQDAPRGWIWVACAWCSIGYLCHHAAAPGPARECWECRKPLAGIPNRNSKRERCLECAEARRLRKQRGYNNRWLGERGKREYKRAYDRAYQQRRRLERIARELMEGIVREIMGEGEAA